MQAGRQRSRWLVIAASVILLGWIFAPARPAWAAGALQVAVVGNQLRDGSGNTLRLVGFNRAGTEFTCMTGHGIFDGPSDAASVASMASWHINAVRLPLNEDCWLGVNGVSAATSGTAYRTAVQSYVRLLHQYRLYVIVSLHRNAPGAHRADGAFAEPMADLDHSPAFWASVASTFKADPGVIFDLFNEPHDISWACWRDGCTVNNVHGTWRTAGMQTLVSAVRETGARQPLLLGGPSYAADLRGWLTYRPVDPVNALAASFHLYDNIWWNNESMWNSTVQPVAQRAPVITGELGQHDCRHSFIDRYMQWADGHGVSYLAWTWNTWSCTNPALIADYRGTPTLYGAGFRNHLALLRLSVESQRSTATLRPRPTTPGLPTAAPSNALQAQRPSRAEPTILKRKGENAALAAASSSPRPAAPYGLIGVLLVIAAVGLIAGRRSRRVARSRPRRALQKDPHH